ncbi:UDP-N-acetylmuramoyl-tripeptide--D-alanyl-D-alanine ligase [Paenibacillus sp. JSM ZJ436]|uniref:UDP-N-acetylmuramoyl-tripeptide--D-alanyl-D- alanine ligase n=1 Tax=Paenibacillus sp. JSM ZJ436 TaxID=3376190 RepID=UPI0037B8DD6C
MIHTNLKHIAAMCGGVLIHSENHFISIQGVSTDSRTLPQGCLYVPLAGERFDGHDYAEAALQQGASAVLWQTNHGTPPEGPVVLVEDTLLALQSMAAAYLRETGVKVVGITGSNGKTTVKDMVTSLLGTRYNVHKTQGNFNNQIGLPLTVLGMSADTEIVVLEMGMSGRHEIELLSKLARPDVAVITNIGESHLLQLGSRKEIARAKAEILSGLQEGGLLVFHGDEPLLHEVLAEPETRQPEQYSVFKFGTEPSNDNSPAGLMFHEKGVIFTSTLYDGESFSLPLLGKHNVINALAAMAVASHFGVSREDMREGFASLKLTSMRIEAIQTTHGVTVLNDAYNASPLSVKAALDVLAGMNGYRRRIAVLGDMLELGDQEQEYHAEIGQYIAVEHIDHLYTYGPLALHIAEAAQTRLSQAQISAFTDKAALIEALVESVGSQDLVLVKASRGMKLEEVVDALKQLPQNENDVRG